MRCVHVCRYTKPFRYTHKFAFYGDVPIFLEMMPIFERVKITRRNNTPGSLARRGSLVPRGITN